MVAGEVMRKIADRRRVDAKILAVAVGVYGLLAVLIGLMLC